MPSLGQAITLALLSALPWPFSYDSAPAAVQQECTCRCECGPCSSSGSVVRGWSSEAVGLLCLGACAVGALAALGLAVLSQPGRALLPLRREAAADGGRRPTRRAALRGAIPLDEW